MTMNIPRDADDEAAKAARLAVHERRSELLVLIAGAEFVSGHYGKRGVVSAKSLKVVLTVIAAYEDWAISIRSISDRAGICDQAVCQAVGVLARRGIIEKIGFGRGSPSRFRVREDALKALWIKAPVVTPAGRKHHQGRQRRACQYGKPEQVAVGGNTCGRL